MSVRHGGLKIFGPAADLCGHGFLHTRWQGRVYPPFIDPAAIAELQRRWDTDEHDIIICTHQKVGTHLTKKFVVEILREAVDYPADHPMAGGDIGHHTVPWPEVMVSQYGYARFEEFLRRTAGRPRVWYTHCGPDDLPMRRIHPRTRLIMTRRDPRGAAVSQYFFYKRHPLLGVDPDLALDDFVDMFAGGGLYFGDYHEHALAWHGGCDGRIPAGSLLLLRFEDLVERKLAAARRIADHIAPGHGLDGRTLATVAAATEFGAMKRSITANPGSFHFDPKTFFRSGRTDDWAEHLSARAVCAIDAKTARVWGAADLDQAPETTGIAV